MPTGVLHQPATGTPWAEQYDTAAGDIWWTATRVAEDAEHWVCLNDPATEGYVAARLASPTPGAQPELEVFVAAGPGQVLCSLLIELRRLGHECDATRVVFFCDSTHEGAAHLAAYTIAGHYQDWIILP